MYDRTTTKQAAEHCPRRTYEPGRIAMLLGVVLEAAQAYGVRLLRISIQYGRIA